MSTLEAAIEARRRQSPRRIAEEARATLDILPVLRAADGKSEAAREARRGAGRCFAAIADLCLDDRTLPPPPERVARVNVAAALNDVVAWGARAERTIRSPRKPKEKTEASKQRRAKPPCDRYLKIWKLGVLHDRQGFTQRELAELATDDLDEPISQQKVSDALKRVERWHTENDRPDLANYTACRMKRPRTIVVDPAELDGAFNADAERQTDGRSRRPRKND